ncbi:MAG: family 43 glycosylhydrolase [Alicyclobacillus sp.]|nr:family 43 glycosylhydrolase [Alicyclobacillus sp.]
MGAALQATIVIGLASVCPAAGILSAGGAPEALGHAGTAQAGVTPASTGRQPVSVPYRNPVFQPTFADPSVIRAPDGEFYAYATEDDWGNGIPHLVPVIRSRDLVHWKLVGDAFRTVPAWHEGGIWAPDVHAFRGKYYMYYAMSTWGDLNPGIGVATANTPAGPFVDHGKLFTSDEIHVANAIDPDLVVDHGTPYLFFGSFNGIFGVQLSKDGLRTAGRPFQIAQGPVEASFIMRRNGYYYYFGSQGTCCNGVQSTYHVVVARSRSLRGPYVDARGVSLMKGGGTLVIQGESPLDSDRPIVGPGHISVIQDDAGSDWMLYHAIDFARPLLPDGATRRPLMLDRLEWRNGWPFVRGRVPSHQQRQGPSVLSPQRLTGAG